MVSSNKSINGDPKTWSELVSLGLSMISLCMVGKNNAGTEKYSEEELVMRLVKEIPRNQNFQIYILTIGFRPSDYSSDCAKWAFWQQ